MRASVYNERVVAFIDIWGFKKVIEASEKDEKIAQLIFQLQGKYGREEFLKQLDPYHPAPNPTNDFLRFEVSQFSDSFVMSIEVTQKWAFKYFPFALGFLMEDVFQAGCVIRGGISFGKLCHKSGGILFGPALNIAYEFEKNMAVWPRVVINPGLLKQSYFEKWDFFNKGKDYLYQMTYPSFINGFYKDVDEIRKKLLMYSSFLKELQNEKKVREDPTLYKAYQEAIIDVNNFLSNINSTS